MKLVNVQIIKDELERLIRDYRFYSSAEAKYRHEAYKELSEWLDGLDVKDDMDTIHPIEDVVSNDPIANSYKEKYEQALEVAKETYDKQPMYREWLEKMFPELKESEDEKVRNGLVRLLKELLELGGVAEDEWDRNECEKYIAWLEKQGEQKPENICSGCINRKGCINCEDGNMKETIERNPADKVEPFDKYEGLTDFERTLADICIGWIGEELGWKQYIKDNADVLLKIAIKKFNSIQDVPFEQKSADTVAPKFKVGDWITDGYVGGQITSIEDNYPCYKIADFNGGINTSIPFTLQDNYHLWTIQDAKDGDVLATLDYILIFKKLLPKDGGVSYCHYDFGCSTPQFNFNKDDNWYFGKEAKVYPATKEQRELLFQKMKEAGYEWDEKNKKLKEIEKPTDVRTTGYWHVEDVEQKPTDEGMKRLLQTEYEKGRADAIAEMQKEWSEEDENRMKKVMHILSLDGRVSNAELQSIYAWLKSLRPHQQWKPSDEQMEVLLSEVTAWTKGCPKQKVLESLYNDLNKLKEE